MAPRALVLDLDGTTWDSRPWIADLVGEGRASGVESALETLRTGGNAARLLSDAGLKASFTEICGTRAGLSLYPGVRSAIQRLSKDGVPLGVVTNLPSWMAVPMLASVGLDTSFRSVMTWGKTRYRKPHPEPLLTCLSELGVRPAQDVWYVGDSDADCQTAVRAGVSFAWASYGYDADEPTGSHAAIPSFAEVIDL